MGLYKLVPLNSTEGWQACIFLEYYQQCGTRTGECVQVIIFKPLVILKRNRW